MHLVRAAAQRIIRRSGKWETILGNTREVKVATIISLDSLLRKILFSFVKAKFFYISGNGSETALPFKLHIFRTQSGAHLSESWSRDCEATGLIPIEDILPKYKASSQLFCSKAKCIRLVLSPPPSPHNTWANAAFLHQSKANLSSAHFCGLWLSGSRADVARDWDSLCKSHVLFCYWILAQQNSIFDTSPLFLPLKYHWHLSLTPGQTYHSTF